jgi:hypothetical protein
MPATAEPPLLATMLSAAAAGSLSRVPCHPLDTIKSVQQAARGPASGLLATARALVSAGGARSLYRGFGVTFAGSAPACCLYLTAYEDVKRRLAAAGAGATATHLAAGIAAEAASCVFWVPIDVLKERMQVQGAAARAAAGAPYYASAADGAAQILRAEGVRGLYRGYGATLASFAPYSAIYFALYERAREASWRALGGPPPAAAAAAPGGGSAAPPPPPPPLPPLPLPWQIASAASAGCAAALVTNPLELAKLRLQVQRGGGAAARPAADLYHGTLHAIATIAREEGARALFRGAAARIAFHVPGTAITMTLFEELRPRIAAMLLR